MAIFVSVPRALVASIAFGVTAPAWAMTVDWTLYEPTCTGGSAAIEVPCGDYGVFHFLESQAPNDCTPIAHGSEDPPPYGLPGSLHGFPIAPRLLSGALTPHPSGSGVSGLTRAGAGSVTQGNWIPAPAPPQGPVNPIGVWIAVIDFDSPHGASTSWLADEAAGPEVDAYLSPLDDPALAALGEVGDFHVLAKLCAVADKSALATVEAPRVVNMSFGRAAADGDNQGHVACNAHRGSCQIARVIEHLREQGTRFVAAAGNHQELLFPAVLPNVLAAGMLDTTAFFHGVTSPAWETPGNARAWIPGNALCLDDWAAPAGSSYSSAMLAGWLSEVIEHSPNIDPLSGPVWAPRWNDNNDCYALTFGNRLTPWCNSVITTLLEGLAGENETVCWLASTTPSVALPPAGGPSQGQPPLPSASQWNNETHPAPESDPCVPCLGQLVPSGGSDDLVIDMSQSSPLPAGVFLDSVLLRTGPTFYPVPLGTTDLLAIQNGLLAQLTFPGWGSLLPTHQQPSLAYRLKTDEDGDCSDPGVCYWSSTPILLKN